MGKKLQVNKVKANPIKNNAPFSKKRLKAEQKKNKKLKPKIKKKSLINFTGLSQIGCKMKRLELFFRRKVEFKKIKKQEREKRQEENKVSGQVSQQPQTIEDKRELDDDFIYEEDEELLNEEKYDEFASYFDSSITPKIFMTTSIRPSRQLFEFLKEIKTTFPSCYYYPRQEYTIKEIADLAPKRGYTDLMIVRESRKQISEIILVHLPKGPTAIFKVTNLKLNKEIYHHGNPTDHFPELILNNFNTNVGRRIARFFSSLFPQKPEFIGRRVVTFHNQRDFIFFRHHRYIFDDDGNRAKLQEIGPRFTLKLKSLQKGIFDNKFGELEFQGKADMYISRKKFYL